MKPVLVLQNLTADGPAYLRRWLEREGVSFDVFDTQSGQDYPRSLAGYRALALLGGEMSANDPLPSLAQAQQLILEALDAGIPMLGHCLGGQLMAKAMGARIVASPKPEIGWQPMQVNLASRQARAWFGDEAQHTVYHWHQEAFELPTGAESLATSRACTHQAFAVGPHLAMQFHVELDAEKLAVWARARDPRYLAQQREFDTVQSGPAMLAQAERALPVQQRLADRIYRRWLDSAA